MNQREVMGILASTVVAVLSWNGPAQSQAVRTPYPEMAPADQYLIANREDEIARARSAAPPSISADAQVLVLGRHGYETAVKGTASSASSNAPGQPVSTIPSSGIPSYARQTVSTRRLRIPSCHSTSSARSGSWPGRRNSR